MNRTTGMLGLFAAGVVVGVVGTKWLEPRADAASAVNSPPPVLTPAISHETGNAAPPVASPAPTPPPRGSPVAPPSDTASGSMPETSPASAPLIAKSAPYATPVDSGTVQPIDVGDRLRKLIDRPSIPGHENEIGDAHRALEREPRDDGWAYSMEAELQNSFVNEVSSGDFKVDGVECRSTICEVRISGTAAQSSAVKRWNDSLMGQPFGQRLFMNYGSTLADNERVDGIFIFRKPKTNP